jgi:endoglucanase
MDDQETFDKTYAYAKKHLQREEDSLFAWRLTEEGQSMSDLEDKAPASDADQDIALALLFAAKKWNNEEYKNDARQILEDIWAKEVGYHNDTPYLLAGNWSDTDERLVLNPSYFSPAYYRIFDQVDAKHNWTKLIDSSYKALQACTENDLGAERGVLPPEWCDLKKDDGTFVQSNIDSTVNEYGYNSFRVPWRVALDYKWYDSQQAKEYLSTLDFLKKEYQTDNTLQATYTHDGKAKTSYESSATYGASIGYFVVQHPELADKFYQKNLLGNLKEREQSYWDEPKNYYTQNWAWFGTALYADELPNIWEEEEEE